MKTIFLALAFLGYTQCAKLDHLKYLPPDSRPASSDNFDQGLAAPDSKGPQLIHSAHGSPSASVGPKQASANFGSISQHSSPSAFGGPSSSSSGPAPTSAFGNSGSNSPSGGSSSSHISNFGPSNGYSGPSGQPQTSHGSPDSNTAGSHSQSSFSPNQPSGYSQSSNIAAPSNFGKSGYYSQQKYQPSAPQNQIPIIKLETTNNGDGSYSTAYETGNGIQAAEQGETSGDNSLVQGAYSYTSPEGDRIDLSYTADENGYHPHGDNLPTPPPVPDAILKSIEYNKAHPEEENNDGSYKDDSQSNSRQYLSPKPGNTPFHGHASHGSSSGQLPKNQQPSASYGYNSAQPTKVNGPSASNSQFGPSKSGPSAFLHDSNVSPSSVSGQYSSQFSGSPNSAPQVPTSGISGQYSPQAAQGPSAFSHGSSNGYSAPQTSGSSNQYPAPSHGSSTGYGSHPAPAPQSSGSSSISGQYSPQVQSPSAHGYSAPQTSGPSSQYSAQAPSAFSHGSSTGYGSHPAPAQSSGFSNTASQNPSVSHVSSGISGQYSPQASSKSQIPSGFSHGSTNEYSAPQTSGSSSQGPSSAHTYSAPQNSDSNVSPTSVSGQYSYQGASNSQPHGFSSPVASGPQVNSAGSQGYQYNAPSAASGASGPFGASKSGSGEFGPGFAGNHVNPSKVVGVQAQDASGAYIY